MILSTDKVISQAGSFSGWDVGGKDYLTVHVKDGNISRIEITKPSGQTGEKIFISPGFIDTQVNGYASVSFSEKGLTEEAVRRVVDTLFREGVTTFFPTIVTSPGDIVLENLSVLATVMKDSVLGHVMPGVFLEGPYISPEDGFRGAHDRRWVRLPDWEEFNSFYRASGRKIIQVGLAPELEGAIEFISKVAGLGVYVSLAHHNGSAEIIGKAVDAGARISTHLGNGCANYIHRHNNPVWPQLADSNLTASIIADGHHLTKDELTVFFKAKGPDRIMLVSDVTELAGMPPGEYSWDGKKVIMTREGKLIYPEQEVLAGASLPIRTGIMNMVRLAGCALAEAVNLASLNPARVYDLSDRAQIKPGLSADLVLFTIENNTLVIQKTIVRGKEKFNK
ncbi:MAG TPA: amidohydrolase family protein [Cyclobacteriaceae bacterium]|nr:amidohydrolase family protein [Cyclobacteriaceae bacterium]